MVTHEQSEDNALMRMWRAEDDFYAKWLQQFEEYTSAKSYERYLLSNATVVFDPRANTITFTVKARCGHWVIEKNPGGLMFKELSGHKYVSAPDPEVLRLFSMLLVKKMREIDRDRESVEPDKTEQNATPLAHSLLNWLRKNLSLTQR